MSANGTRRLTLKDSNTKIRLTYRLIFVDPFLFSARALNAKNNVNVVSL